MTFTPEDHVRMSNLLVQLDELDPEHGDSNAWLCFLDEYPADEEDPDYVDDSTYRDDMAKEYADFLEEWIADLA